MSVSAFSQLSSVSKLVTIIQCGSGTSASTSCGYLAELGGIMRYQPANASAAKWRLFRLLTPASYTPLAQRSHRGHGGRGGPSACKKGSLRDLKTGTGFAGAKLSEILPAARDARFVRMTARQERGTEPLTRSSIRGIP